MRGMTTNTPPAPSAPQTFPDAFSAELAKLDPATIEGRDMRRIVALAWIGVAVRDDRRPAAEILADVRAVIERLGGVVTTEPRPTL